MRVWSVMSDLTKVRLIFGFLMGPLIPGLLGAAYSALSSFGSFSVDALMIFLWIAAILGYPIALLVGIPLYCLFRRRGWVAIYHYIGIGIPLGLASVALFCLWSRPEYVWPIDWFLKGALMGGIATMSFWLIARPDQLK